MSLPLPASRDAPKSCCTPARVGGAQSDPFEVTEKTGQDQSEPVDIPGGTALVGTKEPIIVADAEGPLRKKKVRPFRMDAEAVTNKRFAAFVEDTGYVTEAERFGNSFVFHTHLPQDFPPTQGVAGAEWWRMVDGACWRRPNGPGSEDECKDDHPAVQISWNDARAFADWAGGRLPTEAEWEHAARGGLGDVRFPWGDQEPNDEDYMPCNIWQGRFPHVNTGLDGYKSTAPARSFEPNGYGLFNMVGNVWEWTSEPFKIRTLRKASRQVHAGKGGYKLQKGGSFLCHISYCYRYRIAARHGNSPDTATGHQGLRLVYDA